MKYAFFICLALALALYSNAFDISGLQKIIRVPSFGVKKEDVGKADLTWSECGGPEDLLTINSLTYSPEVPVRGQPLTVNLDGYVKEAVDRGSKANLLVKWGYVRVPVPPVDICKELDNLPDVPDKCPLPAGPIKTSRTFTLPADIPDGKFDVTIRLKNQDDRQISCLKINLSF